MKRYRNEPGSQQVSSLIDSAEHLIIARLTKVEVSAALVRRARRANAEAVAEVNAALAAFDEEILRSFDIVELDETVMEQAAIMARKHGLRGADAIQLACAIFAQHDGSDAQHALLSADDELNAAAIAEGLRVENPNLQK